MQRVLLNGILGQKGQKGGVLLGCGGPPDACYQPPLPSNPASLPGQLQLPLIYHAGHTCGRLALGAGQLHGEHLTHSSERMARAHESCPPLRWAPAPHPTAPGGGGPLPGQRAFLAGSSDLGPPLSSSSEAR